MSEKMECPGCGGYSSSVLADFRNGEPCRFCGLPHEAANAIKAARRTSADRVLLQQYEAAITRATKAEDESNRLRALLNLIRSAIDEFDHLAAM